MNENLIRRVAKTALRAASDLGNLVPLLRENCSEEEYEKLKGAIALASATIGLEVLNLIYKDFPDVKVEFEADVEKFGRVL